MSAPVTAVQVIYAISLLSRAAITVTQYQQLRQLADAGQLTAEHVTSLLNRNDEAIEQARIQN